MTRPNILDLTVDPEAWREVRMPGANLDLALVPLASEGEAFTIMGRFPPGFERAARGGYFAAEEVLVLDGYLELEGVRYVPGDLTFVPPNYLRTHLSAPEGCRVLAWFGGPAIFRTEEELGARAVSTGIVSVPIGAAAGADFLVTADARWSARDNSDAAHVVAGSDVVDRRLSQWQHIDLEGGEAVAQGTFMQRSPLASG